MQTRIFRSNYKCSDVIFGIKEIECYTTNLSSPVVILHYAMHSYFMFRARFPFEKSVRIFLLLTISILFIVPLVIGQSSVSQNRPQASPTVLATSPSWNPATNCNAVVLTLEQLIGSVPNPSQKAPSQGADYSGGTLTLEGAKPAGTNPASSSWPYSKRSTSPPCSVTLPDGSVLPTLVEIHGVKVGGISMDECGSVFANTCDETFNTCNTVLAPNCNSSYPDTMHKVHNEIDMYWVHNGIAPSIPTAGSVIDVQGFVFWDDAHLSDSWHSFSGWEVHPFTAWRLSTSSGQSDFSISSSPSSLTIPQGSSGTATISVSSLNGFAGTIALSASVSPSGPNVSLNPTSVTLSSGATHSSTLSVTVPNTVPAGSYSVQVTGSNGSLAHSTIVSVTVTSPSPSGDFTISANPSSLTIPVSGSGTSKITLTSVNGFAGTISLSATDTASHVRENISPSGVTLTPGGSGTATLTVTSGRKALPGTYSVTIVATSGTITQQIVISLTII